MLSEAKHLRLWSYGLAEESEILLPRLRDQNDNFFNSNLPLQGFNESGSVCPGLVSAGDRFAHGGISLDIFHSDVIHNPEVSRAKSICHRLWDERFSLDHFGAHFLRPGAHFLLDGHRGRAADLGLRLRDAFVCLGLLSLQFSADVVADIHVSDVD